MKKSIKYVALIAIIVIAVAFLAACNDNSNKLVATKTTEDEYMGKYDEKIEITFKDEEAQEVKWTYSFDDEENAQSLASMYSLFSDEGVNVETNGKNVTITMNAETFTGLSGEGNSKAEIKTALEEERYTVK